MKATTILGLKHKGRVAIGCDGQVTTGDIVMKHTAKKIRKMYNNKILTGVLSCIDIYPPLSHWR